MAGLVVALGIGLVQYRAMLESGYTESASLSRAAAAFLVAFLVVSLLVFASGRLRRRADAQEAAPVQEPTPPPRLAGYTFRDPRRGSITPLQRRYMDEKTDDAA